MPAISSASVRLATTATDTIAPSTISLLCFRQRLFAATGISVARATPAADVGVDALAGDDEAAADPAVDPAGPRHGGRPRRVRGLACDETIGTAMGLIRTAVGLVLHPQRDCAPAVDTIIEWAGQRGVT